MTAVVEQASASASQDLSDELILLALLLLRYNSHLRRRALLRLQELQTEILRQLGPLDLTLPTKRAAVQHVERALLPLIERAYQDVDRDLLDELVALVALVSDLVVARIDVLVGVPGIGRPLPAEARRLVPQNALIDGAVVTSWLGAQAGGLLFGIRRVLTSGAANASGATEINQMVREAIAIAQRQAMPIVRTAVNAVFGASIVAIVEENSRLLGGFTHTSILDSRTSEVCRRRAGLRFLADGSPVGHSLPFRIPPLHINCRSHLTPWFYPVDQLPRGVASALKTAGREDAFRDLTDGDPDLGDWLASRSVLEQEATVGRSRLNAWRNGEIITSSLLDQAARPLTLQQIRNVLGL
jgi:SPP1 gp7 family putative phage head morphogenesis protein